MLPGVNIAEIPSLDHPDSPFQLDAETNEVAALRAMHYKELLSQLWLSSGGNSQEAKYGAVTELLPFVSRTRDYVERLQTCIEGSVTPRGPRVPGLL